MADKVQTTSVALPPEVIDAILDHLHSDQGTLLTCSLVSSLWLPASRYHAFGRIALHTANLVDFLETINAPRTTLAPYVRRIDIAGLDVERFNAGWLQSALPRLGAVLTHVCFLRLADVNWANIARPSRSAFLQAFAGRITALEIVHIKFETFNDLVEVLASFPLLRGLVLDNLGWSFGSDPVPDGMRPPGHLHSLALMYCYKRDVLNWFLRDVGLGDGRTPRVQRVDFGQIYDTDTVAAGRYLKALGESLEQINVGFSGLNSGGDAEEFCRSVDLSHNSRLRTIHINNFVEYDCFRLASPHEWIPLILAQINSRFLEQIVFDIGLDDEQQLEKGAGPVDWERYDLLLEGKEDIKRVGFYVKGDVAKAKSERQKVESVIKNLMPRCQAKGILYFQYPQIFS